MTAMIPSQKKSSRRTHASSQTVHPPRSHFHASPPTHHHGFLQHLLLWGHPLTTEGRKSTDWRYQEVNGTRKYIAPGQPLTNEGGSWRIISNSSSLMVTFRDSSILTGRLIFSPSPGSFPGYPPSTSRGHLPRKLPAPKSLSQYVFGGKSKQRPPPSRLFLPHMASFSITTSFLIPTTSLCKEFISITHTHTKEIVDLYYVEKREPEWWTIPSAIQGLCCQQCTHTNTATYTQKLCNEIASRIRLFS